MNHTITIPEGDGNLHDEVEPEYDFSQIEVVRHSLPNDARVVDLEPDIAAAFPTSQVVNEALRKLMLDVA